MSSSLNLNPAQAQAVRQVGHLLVTACPGSGKTAVLKERAIHKLRSDPNCRGVGVTFTKDAAKELLHRVLKDFPDAADRFRVGTFHSLCMDQLRRSGINVSLVNDAQQNQLIHRAWTETSNHSKSPLTFEKTKKYIESIKSKPQPDLSRIDDFAVAIYRRYEELLRRIDAMDFSDLIVRATQGMMNGTVLPMDGNFMLVDEFQDTDEVGLAWVDEHRRNGFEITVVGDDDQSIYGWRNAEGFRAMEKFRTSSNAAHINLDTTYRCAQEIIEPAARLIVKNDNRMSKRLRTENMLRGTVRNVKAADRNDEFNRLMKAIEESGRPGSWGVLARSNKILDAAETVLGAKFEVSRNNDKSFWEMQAPSLYLSLCKSMVDDNLVGVDHALKMAGLAEVRLNAIHARFPSRQRGSLTRYIQNVDARALPAEAILKKSMRSWLDLCRKGFVETALDGIEEYLKTRIKFVDDLAPPTVKKTLKEREERRLLAASRAMKGIRGTLRERVRYVSHAKKDQDDPANASERVRLMTIHGSKGLEFPNVWILGCEDGVVPASGSPKEEERRLFYVGMTRAKQNLYMSHSVGEPTEFLKEAGVF